MCIEGFDHHCVWLNRCIGGQNYQKFLVLITFSIFKDLWIIGTSIPIVALLFVNIGSNLAHCPPDSEFRALYIQSNQFDRGFQSPNFPHFFDLQRRYHLPVYIQQDPGQPG